MSGRGSRVEISSGVRVSSIQRSIASACDVSAASNRSQSSKSAALRRIASRSQMRCRFSNSLRLTGRSAAGSRKISIVRRAARAFARLRFAPASGPQSCNAGSGGPLVNAGFHALSSRSRTTRCDSAISGVPCKGSTRLASRASSCHTPVRKKRIRSSIRNRLWASGPSPQISIIRQRRNGALFASASQCASGNAASARPNDGHGFPPEPGAAAQELAKSPSSSIPAQSRTIRRSKLVRPKSVESASRADDESVAGVSSSGSRRSKRPSRASSAMRFR